MGAQQLGRAVGALVFFAVFGGFEALFQLGQLAVLQFGHLVEIALAGEFFNLGIDALDFFHHVFGAVRLGFFGLPDFVQVRDFLLQLADFFFNQAEALL